MPAILFIILSLLISPTASAQEKSHAGVKIQILTQEGKSFITGPLKKHAKGFSAKTGARIEIVTMPFARLYSKIISSFKNSKSKITGAVFAAQWLPDFVQAGYLVDLTDRVQSDSSIQWQDITNFYRRFSSRFNNRVYTIPLDGDFHMVYYRSDILEQYNLKPPKTWKEYLRIAKALNGKDLNGDDIPDYGSCIAKKDFDQSYWMFFSIAAPFIQSQGTSQGIFFNLDTMAPLVNNEAFAKALKIYKQTSLYGPNEMLTSAMELRDLFISGRCALALDWGDIGTMAQMPESKVKNKVGAVITPGTTSVLNRDTGRLETCTSKTCPFAIGGINYAPYAAFGGWAGAISKNASAKEASTAYDFLSYVSNPQQSNIDVTMGATGFNPYRISQFQDNRPWLKSGMSKKVMHSYLGAIEQSLNSSNMAMDLRIPFSKKYMAEALDKHLHRFLAGKQNISETMKHIEKSWDRITDDADRSGQLKAYRASIGAQ